MGFMMGIMLLMSLAPNLTALVKSKVYGYKIFEIIDRVPEIKDKENAIPNIELC